MKYKMIRNKKMYWRQLSLQRYRKDSNVVILSNEVKRCIVERVRKFDNSLYYFQREIFFLQHAFLSEILFYFEG